MANYAFLPPLPAGSVTATALLSLLSSFLGMPLRVTEPQEILCYNPKDF